MLRAMAAFLDRRPAPFQPAFQFTPTPFWQDFVAAADAEDIAIASREILAALGERGGQPMMRPARRGGAAGREDGTRFRLYPAYDDGFRNPECILLSPPAGSLEPGPSDMRMYTVNPLCKDAPYDPPFYEPPYRGPQHAPACPDPAGQFDRIPIDSQQFLAAHTYGAVRRTLDIWEAYLGRPVTWWHAAFLPQLELVARVEWANAHSGPGYLEMGRQADETGRLAPFCLNYDVLAHETGHAILFSQVGIPPESSVTREFLAFHESFADLIGLVGTMHFRSIIGQLLTETAGNLYIENVISRLGEISRTEQYPGGRQPGDDG